MTDMTVTCDPLADGDGWSCLVRLALDGGRTSDHRVLVRGLDLARHDPGAADPSGLVQRSFEFLLEREPPGSILATFELPVIGRYFPEYEQEMRRRRPPPR